MRGMPHQDKSVRAQHRAAKRRVAKLGGDARAALALLRDRQAAKAMRLTARYARLSSSRLIELGERAGLVEEKEKPEEPDETDPAYD